MIPSIPVPLDTLRRLETPEGIELSLRVAGPVARALAWSVDSLIRYGALWGLLMVLTLLGGGGFGLWLIALFLTEWLYPALFEVYAGGATPGKKALGLKVIPAFRIKLSLSSSPKESHVREAQVPVNSVVDRPA